MAEVQPRLDPEGSESGYRSGSAPAHSRLMALLLGDQAWAATSLCAPHPLTQLASQHVSDVGYNDHTAHGNLRNREVRSRRHFVARIPRTSGVQHACCSSSLLVYLRFHVTRGFHQGLRWALLPAGARLVLKLDDSTVVHRKVPRFRFGRTAWMPPRKSNSKFHAEWHRDPSPDPISWSALEIPVSRTNPSIVRFCTPEMSLNKD